MQSLIDDMYFYIEKRGLKKDDFEINHIKSDSLGDPTIINDGGKLYHDVAHTIRISWKNKKTGKQQQKDYTHQNGQTGLTEFENDLNSGCFD